MKLFRKTNNFLFYIIFYHVLIKTLDLLPNLHVCNRFRGIVLTPFFKKVGSGFALASGNTIVMTRNMEIGDNVYIAHDCWINATGGLFIEDGVIISPKNVIVTTKHLYENGAVSLKQSEHGETIIKEGSWIASNCTVAKGVTIGRGNIICSGSSVVKNTEDYYMYGGQPAVKIKKIHNEE